MKPLIGSKTKFSTRGQVVIPARVRENLKIKAGMRVSVEVVDNKIVLTPIHAPSPNHIYQTIIHNGQDIGHVWRWVGSNHNQIETTITI